MDLPDIINELGDNLFLLSAIIGYFMPVVTSAVINSSWSSQVKGIVSVLVSIALGAGTAYVAGQWNGQDITTSVLVILFLGTVMHRNFWKTSGIGPSIEQATNR